MLSQNLSFLSCFLFIASFGIADSWDNAYERIQIEADGRKIVTLMDFERIVNIFVEETGEGFESVIDCNVYLRRDLQLLMIEYEEKHGPQSPNISRERKDIDVGSYKRQCLQRIGRLMMFTDQSYDTLSERDREIRDRLSIQTAYEDTKFCIKGNARYNPNFYDGDNPTDECCREFHICGATIGELHHQFGFLNVYPYNMKQCGCLDRFKTCLSTVKQKEENVELATKIQRLFFDVLKMKCFELKEQESCIKWSKWHDECLEKKVIDIAVIH
uniref:Phospholipase A2 isozymes PA3A/PA3B/PA5 n=1 Tax=Caligus clemensi TaxID=344056 RepID=C1C2D6_CALCM|nr:Phospholipase A2 isozymes PA3A/PA3B/PA5 [Caligus clemensi]